MYLSNSTNEQVDHGANDYFSNDDELDAYFNSIDIDQCGASTL